MDSGLHFTLTTAQVSLLEEALGLLLRSKSDDFETAVLLSLLQRTKHVILENVRG
jgi:hypothetical protein